MRSWPDTTCTTSQFLAVVELGPVPVALLPRSLAERYPRYGLAYLDVSDAPPTTLAIAWPPQSRSTAVAALVRAATHHRLGLAASNQTGRLPTRRIYTAHGHAARRGSRVGGA